MADNEYGPDLLTLVDDEGQEHEFEIVDSIEHNGGQYVALVANYDDPDESLQDDGEEFLEAIEDEAEFDEIAAIFMERLEDLFDFTEEDE